MRRRYLVLLVLLVLLAVGCAESFSGYDESKYTTKSSDAGTMSADPETTPLPRTRPTKMLDPRSPLDAGN